LIELQPSGWGLTFNPDFPLWHFRHVSPSEWHVWQEARLRRASCAWPEAHLWEGSIPEGWQSWQFASVKPEWLGPMLDIWISLNCRRCDWNIRSRGWNRAWQSEQKEDGWHRWQEFGLPFA